jgi:hypothetical protein
MIHVWNVHNIALIALNVMILYSYKIINACKNVSPDTSKILLQKFVLK